MSTRSRPRKQKGGRPGGIRVRGTLIKKTRLALALSMEALARAAELTAETVSRAETGGPVAEVSAAKIAKALRMELDEIRFS